MADKFAYWQWVMDNFAVKAEGVRAATAAETAQYAAQAAATDARASRDVAFGTRDDTVSYLIQDGASKTYAAISKDFARRTSLSGLLPWRVAYANRATTQARVLTLGSLEGKGASYAGRWSNQLQTLLRAGEPGGHWHNPASEVAANYGTKVVLSNGAVPSTATEGNGLGGHQANIVGGGLATLPAETMTSFKIYYRTTNFFAGSADIKVDGTTVTSLTSFEDPGGNRVHTQSVTSGSHTIAVQGTGSSSQVFSLQGIETFYGDETKGVRVYDGTRQGIKVRDLITTWYAWDRSHWELVGAIDPHLVVIYLGDTDWLGNNIPFSENAWQGLIDKIDGLIARQFSLLLVLPPRPVPTAGQTPMPEASLYAWLSKLLSDKAAANPDLLTFLDMNEYWPRLEAGGATNLGLMVETVAPQTPNAAGHSWLAQTLADLLR